MSKAPAKASDQNDLERRVLDPNIAKSEAEWWAKSRIEELERENNELAARIGKELNEENLALRAEIAELVAALKPFGAIDLVESRLPAEFAMLILRARAAIAKVSKP